MEPVVSVSRKEWEAFLADHSRLVEKYRLLLSHLEDARTAIQGLNEKTQQQMVKSGETLKQVRTVLDKLCEETEAQLLGSD
jgi:oligoendopeptidase F